MYLFVFTLGDVHTEYNKSSQALLVKFDKLMTYMPLQTRFEVSIGTSLGLLDISMWKETMMFDMLFLQIKSKKEYFMLVTIINPCGEYESYSGSLYLD